MANFFDENDIVKEPEAQQASFFDPSDVAEQAVAQQPAPMVQPPASDISTAESALEGAKEGLTLGFSGELSGLMGAGLEGGAELLGQGTGDEVPGESRMQRLKRLYNEYKQAAGQRTEKAQEANPASFMAGDIAGGMLTPGMGAAKALKGASQLTKGMAIGAGTGALSEIGRSEKEGLDLASDVAQSAATGGAFGGLLGKFTKSKAGYEQAAKEAGQEANVKALKAAGATASDFGKEIGLKTSARSGLDKAKGAGKVLLEEDLLKYRQSPAELNQALNQKLDDVWSQNLQPLSQQLDQKLMNVNPAEYQQDALKLSEKLLNQVEEFKAYNKYNPATGDNFADNARASAEEMIRDIASAPDNQKMSVVLETKRKLNDLLRTGDWDKAEVSGAKDFLKNVYSELDDFSVKLAEKADPFDARKLEEYNALYSNLSRAKEVAAKSLTRELAEDPLQRGIVQGALDAASQIPFKKDLGATLATYQAKRAQAQVPKLMQKAETADNIVTQRAMRPAQTIEAATDQTEQYGEARNAIKIGENATPEEIDQRSQELAQTYGKSADKLINSIQTLKDKDIAGRRALMFGILQDPENRKMLGIGNVK